MKNLISLDEAVVVKGWDKNDFCINNYKLHVSDTIVNAWLNVSRLCRLCILVHDSVTNKVRHDLMNESISSVWLELGLERQKKILLGNFYREWQYINQCDDSSKRQLNYVNGAAFWISGKQ